MRNDKEAQQAVNEAVAAFGRIDVVVNSAGYGLFGPIEKTTDEQARNIFDTNFFGVLNVLRAALPILRKQRAGHVFQMSSLFGHMSYPVPACWPPQNTRSEGSPQPLHRS